TENSARERPRLGLSVSRKVGGAVERNRVKRLLREAFARNEDMLRLDQDVVVVARPPVAELVEREGLAGGDEALSDLLVKARAQNGLSVVAEQAGEGPEPAVLNHQAEG